MNKDKFIYEKRLWRKGLSVVAGADEVGRGALAGPIVAAAVVFSPSIAKVKGNWLQEIKDSKKLSAAKREYLYKKIVLSARAVAVVKITNTVIDQSGIQVANINSVIKAVKIIKPKVEYLLLDYIGGFNLDLPHQCIVKGDQKVFSIACASIIAKVYRDRLMARLGKKYPQYNWAKNKGYGSLGHRQAIKKFGLSPLHRKSFSIS